MTEALKQLGPVDLSKVMLGVIVALLAWNIKTTYDLSINVAVLNEKVTNLREDFSSVQNLPN